MAIAPILFLLQMDVLRPASLPELIAGAGFLKALLLVDSGQIEAAIETVRSNETQTLASMDVLIETMCKTWRLSDQDTFHGHDDLAETEKLAFGWSDIRTALLERICRQILF